MKKVDFQEIKAQQKKIKLRKKNPDVIFFVNSIFRISKPKLSRIFAPKIKTPMRPESRPHVKFCLRDLLM